MNDRGWTMPQQDKENIDPLYYLSHSTSKKKFYCKQPRSPLSDITELIVPNRQEEYIAVENEQCYRAPQKTKTQASQKKKSSTNIRSMR